MDAPYTSAPDSHGRPTSPACCRASRGFAENLAWPLASKAAAMTELVGGRAHFTSAYLHLPTGLAGYSRIDLP